MAYRSQKDAIANSGGAEQLDSSVEIGSPASSYIQPRKLRFGSPNLSADESENNCVSNKVNDKSSRGSISPPYRKVRALRLFDTPATPKTILQKSSSHNLLNTHTQGGNNRGNLVKGSERPLSIPLHNRTLDFQQQTANINPFTPDSLLTHNKKRCRTQFGHENLKNRSFQLFLNSDQDMEEQPIEMHQAPKRLALQDTNISRYQKEFIEISLIGVGEFGLVYQCLNRLDGCIYAIKKSIKPVAGSSFEKRALNEVWAHAVLGKHDNVVRYYSAWAEDNHMLIQNEYCNGGSLQSLIQKRTLVESELRILLLHVAEGLRYIHSNDLVHMDLKAGNIFLTKMPPVHKSSLPPLTKECYEVGMDNVYEELNKTEYITTYKIGDLGHVTSVKDANVEEGDCRYLPNEILQDDYKSLFKADIFSLGITLYEAAGGGPLPKNGPEWHKLRDGDIPKIPTLSLEFNDLIKQMTHPDPGKRPSSTSIFNNPILSSLESKSKAQLNQELVVERRKNEILLRKLREANKLIKSYEQNFKPAEVNANVKSPLKFSERLRSRKKCATNFKERLRDRNKIVINNIKY